jgi:hypothetical protein
MPAVFPLNATTEENPEVLENSMSVLLEHGQIH